MTYVVTVGLDHDVLTAEEARSLWDVTPEHLRTGKRAGAFIIWSEDEIGRRTHPIICKPTGARHQVAAAAEQ